MHRQLLAFDVPDDTLRPTGGTGCAAGALISLTADPKLRFTDDMALPLSWDLNTNDSLPLASDMDLVMVEDRSSGTFSRSSARSVSGHRMSSSVLVVFCVPLAATGDCLGVDCMLAAASWKWSATLLACSQISATWWGDSELSRQVANSPLFSLQCNKQAQLWWRVRLKRTKSTWT